MSSLLESRKNNRFGRKASKRLTELRAKVVEYNKEKEAKERRQASSASEGSLMKTELLRIARKLQASGEVDDSMVLWEIANEISNEPPQSDNT